MGSFCSIGTACTNKIPPAEIAVGINTIKKECYTWRNPEAE